MFNLYKDIYFQLKGYDMEAVKKEQIEKEKKKRENRIILSLSTKIVIDFAGILYLIIGWICMSESYKSQNYISFSAYIFMLILDLITITLINIKLKKTEIIGIVCVIIFIIFNMVVPII